MNEWYSLASIGNIVIGILLLVGGYMAIRSGKHQKAGEIQDQTTNAQDKAITALKAELETLQGRFDTLERENTRLHQTLNLIKSALLKQGYKVTIDGDMVEITSKNGSSYSHIQETMPPQPRRASRPAPASQWARKTWLEGDTIADLQQPGQQMEE